MGLTALDGELGSTDEGVVVGAVVGFGTLESKFQKTQFVSLVGNQTL